MFCSRKRKEIPDNDDLSDCFGKYFLAPTSYLIAMGIENPNEVIGTFKVDSTMAGFINKNISNRKMKYGNKIFDYEKPFAEAQRKGWVVGKVEIWFSDTKSVDDKFNLN